MTTKIYPDRYTVADIIADVIWTDEGELRGTVTEAAQALKDSGRLMPDLPEKEQDGRWKVSCKHLPISHTSTAGDQVTLRTSYGWWHTDWDEARSLALALLAAADYAERNQA